MFPNDNGLIYADGALIEERRGTRRWVMPSKGKRVASRQNNLRRRRSNSGRNAPARPNIPAAAATATAVADGPSPAAAAPAVEPTAAATAPAATPAAARRPAGQPRGRRFERPAAYNHVGSELKRIGIFSSVLVVVLVAVSFVL